MKLTDSQQETLYLLNLSTCRPNDDTPTLVRMQLAHEGKTRFGRWVSLTAKGKEWLSKAYSDPAFGKRMRAAFDKLEPAGTLLGSPTPRTMPPAEPPKAGATLSQPTTDQPRSKAPRSRPATARRDDGKSPSTPQTTAATPTRRTPGKLSTPRLTPSPPPLATAVVSIPPKANAVRVIAAGKATYYPVTSFGSLKGDKAYVRTTHRIYKSVKVVDASGDVVY